MNNPITLGLVLIASVTLAATTSAAPVEYHLLKEIPVGGDGGWDYLSCDSASHRVYASHGDKVIVIDTEKDAVAGEITDTPGVHGFVAAPKLGHGFSSNGKGNNSSIVDLQTLKTTGKAKTGGDPDTILYASGPDEVYTFNGHGMTASVFSATSGQNIATILLPGDPEFAVYEESSGLIYDNIADKGQLAVIDTKSHKVTQTWPTAPGGDPTGLALDAEHHLLFIGCRKPQLMEMMDTVSGKIVASVPIHAGVDATKFDPATQLVFASTKEGIVTIAHEDAPDKLTVVQELTTSPGSRTMTLDPATHKIYLSAAKMDSSAKPKPVPGTFKILVYGM